MKLTSIAAVLLLAAAPAFAQPAKPAAKLTTAEAQKVVNIIKADKAKTQTYCQLAKLGEQIDEADQKKDEKKVEALSKQMDDLSQKLGPEYVAFMDRMQSLDPKSPDADAIGNIMEGLDKLCGK